MINPLAAVIQYLKSKAALTGLVDDRIAAKHKFAQTTGSNRWVINSQALQVQYAPGPSPDNYTGVQNIRLQVRCYGASQVEASDVYGALVEVVRATERSVVAMPNGDNALLYYLVLDSAVSFDLDPDIKADYAAVNLRASVAETAVTA